MVSCTRGPTELSKVLYTQVPCHHKGIGLLGNASKVERFVLALGE